MYLGQPRAETLIRDREVLFEGGGRLSVKIPTSLSLIYFHTSWLL